jgi:hypothetical protein
MAGLDPTILLVPPALAVTREGTCPARATLYGSLRETSKATRPRRPTAPSDHRDKRPVAGSAEGPCRDFAIQAARPRTARSPPPPVQPHRATTGTSARWQAPHRVLVGISRSEPPARGRPAVRPPAAQPHHATTGTSARWQALHRVLVGILRSEPPARGRPAVRHPAVQPHRATTGTSARWQALHRVLVGILRTEPPAPGQTPARHPCRPTAPRHVSRNPSRVSRPEPPTPGQAPARQPPPHHRHAPAFERCGRPTESSPSPRPIDA